MALSAISTGALPYGASTISPPRPPAATSPPSTPAKCSRREEFPGWGGPRYYEPALKITRENGNRDLVLHYVSHRISGNDLDIVLKDITDPIEVTLHYRVYPEHGILRRSCHHSQRYVRAPSRSRVRNRPPGTCPPAKAINSLTSADAGLPRPR